MQSSDSIQVNEQLVQMLPKGLVTIPRGVRQALGLEAEKRPYLRVKRFKTGIWLEPVEVVPSASLRSYSQDEVDKFIAQDQLDPEMKKWAEQITSHGKGSR